MLTDSELKELFRNMFTITAVTVGGRGAPTLIFGERGRLVLNAAEIPLLTKTFGKNINGWIGREIAVTPQEKYKASSDEPTLDEADARYLQV
jgi:hypothetical protein